MTKNDLSTAPPLSGKNSSKKEKSWVPVVLIGIAIAYLALVLYIPALNVFYQAFKKGFGPFLSNLTKPDFLNAIKLTVMLAAIAIPLNTVFGLCAAWAIARRKFPGRALILSILDLPFSISPVVAGLMIVLVLGYRNTISKLSLLFQEWH